MKPLFFVSDIHLGTGDRQERQHRSESFIRFVSHVARQNGDLVIAGDLFDFWFEYRHVIPRRYLDVLMALRDLVSSYFLTKVTILVNHRSQKKKVD